MLHAFGKVPTSSSRDGDDDDGYDDDDAVGSGGGSQLFVDKMRLTDDAVSGADFDDDFVTSGDSASLDDMGDDAVNDDKNGGYDGDMDDDDQNGGYGEDVDDDDDNDNNADDSVADEGYRVLLRRGGEELGHRLLGFLARQ
jgi:hypothetical protein